MLGERSFVGDNDDFDRGVGKRQAVTRILKSAVVTLCENDDREAHTAV